MPALRKPLIDVTAGDFVAMVAQEWPEDDQLEFKRALPTADGVENDRWITHGDRVGEAAQRGLFKEVVAFANSFGGDVILGIAESKDNPRRAAACTPVPKCLDLAERLAMAARSLIEPQIPRLEVRAIPADDAGNGFVVFRVPRSRSAPHRLTLTKECYRRRRDSSEAMTMREIQDLTFSVARGLDAVDRRLTDLRQAFRRWHAIDQTPAGKSRVAIRITGVPASSDLYVERVHDVAELRPAQHRYYASIGGAGRYELVPTCDVHRWRPILRGTQGADGDETSKHLTLQQLFCDGAIVYQARSDTDLERAAHERNHVLYPGWLFGTLLNAFDAADRFREFTAATSVDYAFEVELATTAPLPVLRMGTQWQDVAGTVPTGEHMLPRYAVGDSETRKETLNTIWRDFWNSIGVEIKGEELAIL